MTPIKGFTIKTVDGTIIRFNFYSEAAPITSAAFAAMIPFAVSFLHARVSGEEIWTDNILSPDIIQENASIFTQAGEVVLGPRNPSRTKTANCMGIYYGEGTGLDCCNIFAKVYDEDRDLLKELGNKIWKQGEQLLIFELLLY